MAKRVSSAATRNLLPESAELPAGPTPGESDPPAALDDVVADPSLSAAQRHAISLLAGGQSIKVAATRVGVHRNTVHRWLRGDPAFRAAYSAWVAEVQESAYARLLSLVDPAVTTLGHAINKRNLQASLALLKGLSAFKPPEPGPEDAEECRRLTRLERSQRQAALMENENNACNRRIHASMMRPFGLEREDRHSEASSSQQSADPTPAGDPKPENPSAAPPTQKETEALIRALDKEDLAEEEDDLEDEEDLDEEDLDEDDLDEDA